MVLFKKKNPELHWGTVKRILWQEMNSEMWTPTFSYPLEDKAAEASGRKKVFIHLPETWEVKGPLKLIVHFTDGKKKKPLGEVMCPKQWYLCMFWIWELSEISLCVDLLELKLSFPVGEKHNSKHLVYTNLAVKGHSQCTSSHKYWIRSSVIWKVL